jgi:ArsR family transcriptional regulator
MNIHTRPAYEEDYALANRLRALAHPVRLRILHALATHQTCQCGEIVRGLPLAQSTVSEHLRILREAGLIRVGNKGARACYCVDRAEIKKLAAEMDRLLAPIAKPGRGRKARNACRKVE